MKTILLSAFFATALAGAIGYEESRIESLEGEKAAIADGWQKCVEQSSPPRGVGRDSRQIPAYVTPLPDCKSPDGGKADCKEGIDL